MLPADISGVVLSPNGFSQVRNDDFSGKIEVSIKVEEVDSFMQEIAHLLAIIAAQGSLRVELNFPVFDAFSFETLLNVTNGRHTLLGLEKEDYQQQRLVVLEAHVGDRQPDAQEVEQVHSFRLDVEQMLKQQRIFNTQPIVESQFS